eukprot:TRINITY_DN2546_c0_g1_i2.p1 TRINITY_DN2546_c0_g1~~TRINITY_DN2546_c0_g1_i2.p1  ORF type:complete len:596 (+),score=131.96 TRINITY_DN2546_c0_g1_i2:72-1859(+)
MRLLFSVLASAAAASAAVETITEKGYENLVKQVGREGILIGFGKEEQMAEIDEYFKDIQLNIAVGAAEQESISAITDMMDMDTGTTPFALLYGGKKVRYPLEDTSPQSVAHWVRSQTEMRDVDNGYLKLVDDDQFSSLVFLPSRVAIALFDTEETSPLSDIVSAVANEYENDILAGELSFVRATKRLAPTRYEFGMETATNDPPQLAFYGRRKEKYKPVFYNGPHTVEAIKEWIDSRSGAGLIEKLKENMLVPLSDATFDPVLKTTSKGMLVLLHAPWCGHCKRVMPTFKTLAEDLRQLRSKILITTVDATVEKTLSRRFNVNGYPTIIYVGKHGDSVEYSGDRSLDSLTEFSYKQIGEQVPGEEPTAVTILRDANIEDIVNKNTAGMFIKFYAPWCGHCKRMAPAYEKLGEHFSKKDVVIAKLDATKHTTAAGKFPSVSGFPTLMWLAPGADPMSAEKYKAGRDFEAMKKWVDYKTGTAPDTAPVKETPPASGQLGTAGSVLHLNADTYKQLTGAERSKGVLVMFHATWCGHCKKLAPDYEKLAKHFADRFDSVVITKYNAPEFPEPAKAAGVKSFPTILYVDLPLYAMYHFVK